MLKRTVTISLCLLLHVSVQLDHPQGAYAELCQSYNIVEFISESTSLYDMRRYGNKYFRLWCVYCVPVLCATDQFHNILASASHSIRSLRMVQLDRNM